MPRSRTIALTLLAMIAFAANSILCRMALKHTTIDPASFTAIRLISGAVMLGLIVSVRGGGRMGAGNWPSALALIVYAAGFSFAYVSLPAATGALLLFGAVQVTMIGHGVWSGERMRASQVGGLMLGAGVAWGVYSLRGKGAGDPTRVTAGNFLRTVPIALVLGVWRFKYLSLDEAGVAYAIASGALASGIGYAIWYSALPTLKATTAATVQLSVPLIAAMGGVVFLAEPVTLRLALASVAVLGGIALVIVKNRIDRTEPA